MVQMSNIKFKLWLAFDRYFFIEKQVFRKLLKEMHCMSILCLLYGSSFQDMSKLPYTLWKYFYINDAGRDFVLQGPC